ncbi:hypothetical protein J6590_029658 [Homalodisca vitripennis]|nr:hypothetical protein J6590_029658 [Homalodisca vitripennis]
MVAGGKSSLCKWDDTFRGVLWFIYGASTGFLGWACNMGGFRFDNISHMVIGRAVRWSGVSRELTDFKMFAEARVFAGGRIMTRTPHLPYSAVRCLPTPLQAVCSASVSAGAVGCLLTRWCMQLHCKPMCQDRRSSRRIRGRLRRGNFKGRCSTVNDERSPPESHPATRLSREASPCAELQLESGLGRPWSGESRLLITDSCISVISARLESTADALRYERALPRYCWLCRQLYSAASGIP